MLPLAASHYMQNTYPRGPTQHRVSADFSSIHKQGVIYCVNSSFAVQLLQSLYTQLCANVCLYVRHTHVWQVLCMHVYHMFKEHGSKSVIFSGTLPLCFLAEPRGHKPDLECWLMSPSVCFSLFPTQCWGDKHVLLFPAFARIPGT